MYPNGQAPQPQQQMPPGQTNPYDFLSQQPAPNKKLPIDLSTTKAKIIAAGGVLAIIFLVFILFSAIFGDKGGEQTQKYINVAKSQTEIIRLATLADENAKVSDTKDLALTSKFALSTSRSDMSEVLGKRGVNQKNLSKQLTLSKNIESDKLLEEAAQRNRYDETITALIFQELEDYQKELQSVASGATQSELVALQQANQQVETLLVSKPRN